MSNKVDEVLEDWGNMPHKRKLPTAFQPNEELIEKPIFLQDEYVGCKVIRVHVDGGSVSYDLEIQNRSHHFGTTYSYRLYNVSSAVIA